MLSKISKISFVNDTPLSNQLYYLSDTNRFCKEDFTIFNYIGEIAVQSNFHVSVSTLCFLLLSLILHENN